MLFHFIFTVSSRKCLGALIHSPAKLLLFYTKLDLNVTSKVTSPILFLLTNKLGKLKDLSFSLVPTYLLA